MCMSSLDTCGLSQPTYTGLKSVGVIDYECGLKVIDEYCQIKTRNSPPVITP